MTTATDSSRYAAWLRVENALCALALFAGVFLRAPVWVGGVTPKWDGAAFDALAQNLAHGAGLRDAAGALDHHHAPVWPLVLAGFKIVGAPSGVAAFFQFAFLLLVVYACTRDLWGPRVALRCASLTASLPAFALAERFGFSETFVAGVYVLLIWAAIKSLQRPGLVPLAGFLAGVVYLSKASLGYSLVVGALAGLAWRVRVVGPRAVLSRDYALAAFTFLLFVLAWAARNVHHFGLRGWETQPYAWIAISAALHQPIFILAAFLFAAWWLVLLVLPGIAATTGTATPTWPWSTPTWPWGKGELSGLWLGALVPIACAVPILAGFAILETSDPRAALAQIHDTSLRYLLIGLPLAYVVISTNKRGFLVTLALNLALCGLALGGVGL